MSRRAKAHTPARTLVCMRPECRRRRRTRGLCHQCYVIALRWVVTGKGTWDELVAAGKVLAARHAYNKRRAAVSHTQSQVVREPAIEPPPHKRTRKIKKPKPIRHRGRPRKVPLVPAQKDWETGVLDKMNTQPSQREGDI